MRKRKTNILLAASAICMLSALPACSGQSGDSFSERNYEHIDYVSSIEKEDCYLCGGRTDHEASAYWGQDNVGLVDVNTFDAVQIEINRYDNNGQLIEEATGSMRMGMCSIGEATASVMSDVDRGYAHIDITPSGNGINADAIGAYLCEDCLDAFASNFFEHDDPPEVAVVNFSTRELRPLEESCPWFTFDNYLVDCTFEDTGKIDLQITYRPVRYQETQQEANLLG